MSRQINECIIHSNLNSRLLNLAAEFQLLQFYKKKKNSIETSINKEIYLRLTFKISTLQDIKTKTIFYDD